MFSKPHESSQSNYTNAKDNLKNRNSVLYGNLPHDTQNKSYETNLGFQSIMPTEGITSHARNELKGEIRDGNKQIEDDLMKAKLLLDQESKNLTKFGSRQKTLIRNELFHRNNLERSIKPVSDRF